MELEGFVSLLVLAVWGLVVSYREMPLSSLMAVVWFPSEFTTTSVALNRGGRGVYGYFRYFVHMLFQKEPGIGRL